MSEKALAFNEICKSLTLEEISGLQLNAFKESIRPPKLLWRSLRMILRSRMELSLDAIVAEGPDEERVFELLERMEADTRLIELLNVIAVAKPGNLHLRNQIEQYSASFLEQISVLGGLATTTLTELVQLHQYIQSWDDVLRCCQITSPEIDGHGPEVVASLGGNEFAPVFKWLIVLRYWVARLPSIESDQYCLLQFLGHLQQLPEVLAPAGQTQLERCISTIQAELQCEPIAPSMAPLQNAQEKDFRVHGFCIIDIELTEGSLRYDAWLDVQVTAGEQRLRKMSKRQRLEQAVIEDSATTHHPDGTSTAVWCTPQLQVLQEKLSGWVKQVDQHLLNRCIEIQQAQDCSRLPDPEITIEFCLPSYLLVESVDAWPWTSLGQPTLLGRTHRIVVRSRDRIYNNAGLLRRLSPMPAPLSVEQWEQQVDVVKNFQCLNRGDVEQVAQGLKQKEHAGLVLTCPFCLQQHRSERAKLLEALLMAGIPIVMWSREHTISRLSSTLKALLTRDTLIENERFNFDILLHEVREQRRIRGELGNHLALWCDEPPRILELHKVLEEGQLGA